MTLTDCLLSRFGTSAGPCARRDRRAAGGEVRQQQVRAGAPATTGWTAPRHAPVPIHSSMVKTGDPYPRSGASFVTCGQRWLTWCSRRREALMLDTLITGRSTAIGSDPAGDLPGAESTAATTQPVTGPTTLLLVADPDPILLHRLS